MEFPSVYKWFQLGIARPDTRGWLSREIIRAQKGERILDVGCGVSSILDELPEVSYIGVDHNPDYIDKARARYGNRAEFHLLDVNDTNLQIFGKFDTVLLLGVLHHLSDVEVKQLMASISLVLEIHGSIIAIDPAFENNQHSVARLLARLDRGRYVRQADHYSRLFRPTFNVEEAVIRRDLLRLPYTHVVHVAKFGNH